jgi:hypothetical protein
MIHSSIAAKLITGDQILVPSNTGYDQVVTVHHVFEHNSVQYVVGSWNNHYGQIFFSVWDNLQIRGIHDAK